MVNLQICSIFGQSHCGIIKRIGLYHNRKEGVISGVVKLNSYDISRNEEDMKYSSDLFQQDETMEFQCHPPQMLPNALQFRRIEGKHSGH